MEGPHPKTETLAARLNRYRREHGLPEEPRQKRIQVPKQRPVQTRPLIEKPTPLQQTLTHDAPLNIRDWVRVVYHGEKRLGRVHNIVRDQVVVVLRDMEKDHLITLDRKDVEPVNINYLFIDDEHPGSFT